MQSSSLQIELNEQNMDSNAMNSEKTIDQLHKELELLAYVLSHNLQSPIRHILAECEELSQQSDSKANAITKEADRLQGMIKHIIEYIQLETHPVSHDDVNCNDIMDTVRTMLCQEIESSGAIIECGPLPNVYGHHGRLTRLFAYLIDNAIKFRRNDHCVINIHADLIGSNYRFNIKDDGIGMDLERCDNIFKLFKRLHQADEYEGYGAGLALAHKILASHNSTLQVKSVKGEGSHFYFDLTASSRKI